MTNYYELENAQDEIAGAKFEAGHVDEPESQAKSRAKHAFVRRERVEWFFSTELYSSIDVQRSQTVEIRDLYFGSSITVYPPQRDYDYENGAKKMIIKPAYINASTWNTGSGDVRFVQRRTKHYLKMMEMALDFQNEMNQPIIEWDNMDSPFWEAKYYKMEHQRMCERERVRREEEEAKKAARAKKLPAANSSSQTR